MSTLDWIIGGAYCVIIMSLGYIIGRNTNDIKDYFSGGKSFAWWAIGASVIATQVSAVTVVGAPGWAYTAGLTPLVLNLNIPVAMWFVSSTLVPFFYNSGHVSIYEYLEERYNYNTRALVAGIFMLKVLAIYGGIVLAPSLVLAHIFDIETPYAILILSIFSIFYTILGGLKAVIWTDLIQAGIMWSGLIISLVIVTESIPYTFSEAWDLMKESGKLNAVNFSTDLTATNTFLGGMIGCLVLHIAYFGTDQAQVQRMLASRNLKNLKKALWATSYFGVFQMFLFLLLGSLLFLFFEGKIFDNPNEVYITFLNYLPKGILGLIVCSILAAGMSTFDSANNSLSTVFVKDFYEKFINPTASEQRKLQIAKICTFVFGAIIASSAIAISMFEKRSLLEAITAYGTYFTGPFLAIFILGIFTKRVNSISAVIGFFSGLATVITVAYTTDIYWMWFSPIGLMPALLVGYGCSFFIGKPPVGIEQYTMKGQKAYFESSNKAEKDGNFYVIPGKFERNSYFLLGYVLIITIILYFFVQ